MVVLFALGLGLVVNSLVSAGVLQWWQDGAVGTRLVRAAVWSPFPLIYVTALAVRVALFVPIELRANWVFRFTEQDAERVDQLAAAAHSVMWLGVFVPAAALFPLHWALVGPGAIGVFVAALIVGWLFVEILLRDWARIPFTCSYVPGKGFVPQVILKTFGSFVVFTTLGTGLAYGNMLGVRPAFVFDGIVLAAALFLRVRRVRAWKHVTLEFEDQLPTETNPLVLH